MVSGPKFIKLQEEEAFDHCKGLERPRNPEKADRKSAMCTPPNPRVSAFNAVDARCRAHAGRDGEGAAAKLRWQLARNLPLFGRLPPILRCPFASAEGGDPARQTFAPKAQLSAGPPGLRPRAKLNGPSIDATATSVLCLVVYSAAGEEVLVELVFFAISLIIINSLMRPQSKELCQIICLSVSLSIPQVCSFVCLFGPSQLVWPLRRQ